MKQNRLSAFILGFMLPAMLFTLVVGPVYGKPVRIKNCSVRSDTKKLQTSILETGEVSEEGSEEAISSASTFDFKNSTPQHLVFAHDYLEFSEHRITDHAHDGRGPPSRS